MSKAMFRQAVDAAVEQQMRVQEAEIAATGDVSDPGPLGLLVTIVETLADGDEASAGELLVTLARWIADEEIEEVKVRYEEDV